MPQTIFTRTVRVHRADSITYLALARVAHAAAGSTEYVIKLAPFGRPSAEDEEFGLADAVTQPFGEEACRLFRDGKWINVVLPTGVRAMLEPRGE